MNQICGLFLSFLYIISNTDSILDIQLPFATHLDNGKPCTEYAREDLKAHIRDANTTGLSSDGAYIITFQWFHFNRHRIQSQGPKV